MHPEKGNRCTWRHAQRGRRVGDADERSGKQNDNFFFLFFFFPSEFEKTGDLHDPFSVWAASVE